MPSIKKKAYLKALEKAKRESLAQKRSLAGKPPQVWRGSGALGDPSGGAQPLRYTGRKPTTRRVPLAEVQGVLTRLGPLARAAAQIDVGGTKRQKVLVLLAAYQDAGVTNPPIRALCERTGFRAEHTLRLLERLETDGIIAVQWGDHRKNERNQYVLNFRRLDPWAIRA